MRLFYAVPVKIYSNSGCESVRDPAKSCKSSHGPFTQHSGRSHPPHSRLGLYLLFLCFWRFSYRIRKEAGLPFPKMPEDGLGKGFQPCLDAPAKPSPSPVYLSGDGLGVVHKKRETGFETHRRGVSNGNVRPCRSEGEEKRRRVGNISRVLAAPTRARGKD